jgi:hypothetical protein
VSPWRNSRRFRSTSERGAQGEGRLSVQLQLGRYNQRWPAVAIIRYHHILRSSGRPHNTFLSSYHRIITSGHHIFTSPQHITVSSCPSYRLIVISPRRVIITSSYPRIVRSSHHHTSYHSIITSAYHRIVVSVASSNRHITASCCHISSSYHHIFIS